MEQQCHSCGGSDHDERRHPPHLSAAWDELGEAQRAAVLAWAKRMLHPGHGAAGAAADVRAEPATSWVALPQAEKERRYREAAARLAAQRR